MSYLSQARLGADLDFQNRTRSALTQQASVYKDDARADIKALADGLLKGDSDAEASFIALLAAAPGFADMVDQGDGTVDSTQVSDGDILAAVQAGWPTVAALFHPEEGTP